MASNINLPIEYLIDKLNIIISHVTDNKYEIKISGIDSSDNQILHKGIFELDTDALNRLIYGFESMHGLTIFYGYDSDKQFPWIKPHHICIPITDIYELKDNYNTEIINYIYVLELSENKYYVGKTRNPHIRISDHLVGKGSEWTKTFKPITIQSINQMVNDFDEDMYTLQLMREHGIDNVRGGSFCKLVLSAEDKLTINRMIQGSANKCYECGKSGHYANKCYIHKKNKVCEKCGRNNHIAVNCYAKKHINGTEIK
jgi:hypothetical protein